MYGAPIIDVIVVVIVLMDVFLHLNVFISICVLKVIYECLYGKFFDCF
jgi:hypothetical protein